MGLGLLAGCGRWPGQAQAPPAKVHRIGYLGHRNSDDPFASALQESLRELGYTEGQNLVVEYRFAAGNVEQLSALAAELAVLNVELIMAGGVLPARAASEAAPQIPVMMVRGGGDAVGTGLIASFARPGGNVTGVVTASADHAGKWLEFLKEAVPRLSRVALLADPIGEATEAHRRELARAAEFLQIRLQHLDVDEPEALTAAFAAMQQEHAEALVVAPGGRVTL